MAEAGDGDMQGMAMREFAGGKLGQMRAEDRRFTGRQWLPVLAHGQVVVVGGEEVESADEDYMFDGGLRGGE